MSEIHNKEEEDEEGEEEEEEEEKKTLENTTPTETPKEMKDIAPENKPKLLEENKTSEPIRTATTKKYRFEELEPLHRPIFNLKSKSVKADERFKMSPQEYLDTFKVSTILQDAFKTILNRREDNARPIFIQYLEATLKGEHILLREHAFVNSTPLNRKCFLQQVRKVFHTTP